MLLRNNMVKNSPKNKIKRNYVLTLKRGDSDQALQIRPLCKL